MKNNFKGLFLLAIMLAACSVSNTTPISSWLPPTSDGIIAATQGMQTSTQAEASAPIETRPPSASPTLPINPTEAPPVTPTAVLLPPSASFGPENYSQFAPVQIFDVSENIVADFNAELEEIYMGPAAYSPDGNHVALSGCTKNWSGACPSDLEASNSFLYILDAHTAEIIGNIPENNATISGLAFTPDGSKLVYAICPIKVSVWDVALGSEERVLFQEPGCETYPRLTVSPDGTWIALIIASRLSILDFQTGEQVVELTAQPSGPVLPKFSGDGSRLAVFTDKFSSEITVFETRNWTVVSTIRVSDTDAIFALDFSPDGLWVATAFPGENSGIQVWDASTGELATTLADPFRYIEALGFTPDGRLLLSSGFYEDLQIYDVINVWDTSSFTLLGGVPGTFNPQRFSFAADGESFFTGSLWRLPDEDLLAAQELVTAFHSYLAAGDYQTAAASVALADEEKILLESTQLDLSDLPAAFEMVCAQDNSPCQFTPEILFGGKETQNEYWFTLRYSSPEGAFIRDEYGVMLFYFSIKQQEDGSMKVMNLPYYFYSP